MGKPAAMASAMLPRLMRCLSFVLLLPFVTIEAQGPPPRLRELTTTVVALHAGNPGNADVLLQWQSFNTELYYDARGIGALSTNNLDPVVAYEAQYAVSGSDVWTSLSTSISGMASGHQPRRSDRHEKQVIFTRADTGQTILDGTFRLTMSFASTSPLDIHQHTVTPPIPFDASEAQMKQALETLDVVSSVQVWRRLVDAAARTYEWTILFDPPHGASADGVAVDHGDLPLLALYSETISAPYTGPGDQVAIQSMREGAFQSVVCEGDCAYTTTALPVGKTLSFRVRAQFNTGAWSIWSRLSEPLVIPSTSRPYAPSAPVFLAASTTQITVQWMMVIHSADTVFPTVSFHLQQMCGRDLSWRSVHTAIPPGRTASTTIASSTIGLQPNTTCLFRVAATNANGHGPFSPQSTHMSTASTAPSPPRQLAPLRDPLRVTWQSPSTDGGSSVTSYQVQVRTFHSSTWTTVPMESVDGDNGDEGVHTHHSCSLSSSTVGLLPYTRYVARVRAKNAMGWSGFAESSDFLTDYRAETVVAPPLLTQATATNHANMTMFLRGASRDLAANTEDLNYVHGVGNGGHTQGEDGEPGVVLVFPIEYNGGRREEQMFFFSGQSAFIQIPADDPANAIAAIDVYAWGGGGGSGGKAVWGRGGGGAFARGVFRVTSGDRVHILVGSGGRGFANGGRGGWNGGGDGGSGGFPGGGGGGASEVQINGKTVLVAGGGGGGGSSDYCCAHGGGGGGTGDGPAEDGLFPDGLSIPLDSRITGQPRPAEYFSSNVYGDLRDLIGLPARHSHLDYGRAGDLADFSVLATGGQGASLSRPGGAGRAASYVVSRFGKSYVNPLSGSLEIGSSLPASQASPGRRRHGGNGQDGQDCGGGGGGGFYGGGGGGAGVDGAGGGGGSSFVSLVDGFMKPLSAVSPPQETFQLTVAAVSSTSVLLEWTPPSLGFASPLDVVVVEIANRSANEDFQVKSIAAATSTTFLVDALRPAWAYRFRVKPLFRDAAIGQFSDVVNVVTPATPVNLWTRVASVRSLDERTTHAGVRSVDARPSRRLPSARRGHSLTAFDDGFLYLFGGYSGGYACNQAHKAACVTNRAVNNELWRFDTKTTTWMELSTVGGPPLPREKHSMAIVANHLLLFGGRQGGVDDSVAGLNDLWALQISSTTRKTTTSTLRNKESILLLRDGHETVTMGYVGENPDMCVSDLVVTVVVTHACLQSLRIELLGPGPSTHPQRQQTATTPLDSQTIETTWDGEIGSNVFGSGGKRTTPAQPSARSFPVTLLRPQSTSTGNPCVSGPQTWTFSSTPSTSGGRSPAADALAVFQQFSASGGWTLSVTDTQVDGHTGTLTSWDIQFTLVPCVPSYTWTPVATVAASSPSERFQHTAISYLSSMFVFGGRAAVGARPLTDLYRLDYTAATTSGVWTTLVPIMTAASRDKQFYHGRTLVVTSFDLVAVGDGLRTRPTTSEPHVLRSSVGGWRKSVTEPLAPWQLVDATAVDESGRRPSGRYWSSAVFISAPTPRLFLYGGQDDTTLLDDLWVLQLDKLAENEPLDLLESRRLEICTWRLGNSVFQQSFATSCGATSAMVTANTASECSLDTLLLYVWCAGSYQSLQL